MSTSEIKKITFCYHDDDFNKDLLKKIARKKGHSMSQYIVQLIKTALGDKKIKKLLQDENRH